MMIVIVSNELCNTHNYNSRLTSYTYQLFIARRKILMPKIDWKIRPNLVAGPSQSRLEATEALRASSRPQTPGGPPAVGQATSWNMTKILEEPSSDSPNRTRSDQAESSNCCNPARSRQVSRASLSTLGESRDADLSEGTVKGGPSYLPFPCPFCDRAYTSWGFRRRHIKAVHTVSPSLNCKWCLQVSFSGLSRGSVLRPGKHRIESRTVRE